MPEQRSIPVIGSIAAGIPISAIENHSHYLEDLKPMAGRIALEVRDDSMVDAGISMVILLSSIRRQKCAVAALQPS